MNLQKTLKERGNKRNQGGNLIRAQARVIYIKCNGDMSCYNCTYNLFVEIAHIKAVALFSKNSTMEDINNPNNLVALCRNCHYEFDNGFLTLDFSSREHFKIK